MHQDSIGILLITQYMKLLNCNSAAQRMLFRGETIRLDSSKQLKFDDKTLQTSIETLLSTSVPSPASSSTANVMVSNARQDHPVAVSFFSMAQERFSVTGTTGTDIAAATILIRPLGSQTRLPEPLLTSLFCLTHAEAGLAVALYSGHSLEEIARESELSIHTVRDRIKKIFEKTGTQSQPKLLSLLSRFAY